jgi:hypothetical protein
MFAGKYASRLYFLRTLYQGLLYGAFESFQILKSCLKEQKTHLWYDVFMPSSYLIIGQSSIICCILGRRQLCHCNIHSLIS